MPAFAPDIAARLTRALEGRYAIEGELGEGGMAVVYLAEDLKHGRKVALKILKPELAAVVGAERFLAEIRTTANLQHPNILPLHDSGEVDGFLFYVMPHIDGESLRSKLDREKQLSVEEAVRIASEVADALQAAHEQGVIHRDIKPENILLSRGRPLVADFGIALAVGAARGSRLTETGLSLGTPFYMSPEQATGDREVGPASDVYALGCVLYETLVGEPPHVGPTAQAVLGKIIAGQPVRPAIARPSVPAHVDATVQKALEKLPADRFASARDFAAALGNPGFRHGRPEDHGLSGMARPWLTDVRTWIALGAAALFAALWLGDRGGPMTVPGSPAGTSRLERTELGETHFVTFGLPIAISPDGGTVVFVGGEDGERRLYRRTLDDLAPTALQGTEGGLNPFFSPDGQWLGFTQDWGIFRMRPSGSSIQPVREEDVGVGSGPTWDSSGQIFYFAMESELIESVPESGGAHVQMERVEAAEASNLVWWSHLPEANALLVTDWRFPPRMGVLNLDTREVRIDSAHAAFGPHFVPPDLVVFGTPDGFLLGAPFDPEQARITGPPVPIARDVEVANWTVQFAVARSGDIVYVRDELDELIIDGLDGSTRPATAERRNFHQSVSVSPDGSTLAVVAQDGMGEQLRVYDAQGRGQNLTADLQAHHPIFSPDGASIIFGIWDRGIMRIPSVGGTPTPLVEGPGQWQPSAWDPGDRQVAFMNLEDYSPRLYDLTTGQSSPFSEGTDGVGAADYSDDGDLIAFQSLHLDDLQIWLQRAQDGVPIGPLVRVSREGGIAPRWGPDGHLYYIRFEMGEPQRAHLMRAQIDPAGLTVVDEVEVADWSGDGVDSGYRFDFLPSGEIVRVRTRSRREVVLLQGWQGLVRGEGAGG